MPKYDNSYLPNKIFSCEASNGIPYENYPAYIIHRITSKAVPSENGCLEYRAGKLKHKYGLTSITLWKKQRNIPVHRALYMAVNNCFDLPRSTMIRHKCDNPCCVNIAHLLIGAAKDNTKDCIDRGRRPRKLKKHTRQCKLTDEQVLVIKESANRPYKVSHIAKMFGVTPAYVWKIRNGKAKQLI